ncbi:RNA polymerase sigma factor (sigma-70 family) [Curtobacterium sp. 320]|uniref:sigma-70 family RNA polymerase sigma factor n=1 Tax=Curtobacterium sp. 320 TaxID=2817749 RepID=UPI00285C4005|nr:sigma-70 family RNA polymerase sigma factor [Curtobacterium sp. 320]MDR6572776.1 RNA polymerase sigma factor (sigma-70 family) [Curtobacterium sp. 320]
MAALWSRHHRAAVRHATGLVGSSDAEDVVSEAFTNVIDAIERGAGPDELFRPYLYTVIRNVANTEFRRRARHTDADVDFDAFEDSGTDAATEMARAADRTALGRAFSTLPERWQSVLWYTEVEGLRPRHVAPLVDLQPGAVSSLAFRARRALRAAWVQEHLATDGLPDECRRRLAAFGAYEAGTLTARDRRQLEAHIRDCVHCPPVLEDTRRLAGRIAAALLPPVVGLGIGHAVLHADAPAAAAVSTARSASATGAARRVPLPVTGLVGVVAALVVVTTVVAVAGTWSDDHPTGTSTAGARAPGATNGSAPSGEHPAPADRTAPSHVAEPSPLPSPGRDDTSAPTTVPTAPTPVIDTVLGGSSAGASSTPDVRTDEPSASPTPPGTGGSSTTGGVDPQLPRSAPPVPAEDTMLVASRTVELTGEATPGSRVEVRSGTLTAATTTGSDGTWRTTLRFSGDGVERVSITATTPDHATSVPVVVTVTVDTTAPAAPTIATTWTPTDTTPPVFSGAAEAGSTIDVTVVRGTSGTSGTGATNSTSGTNSTATVSTTTGADGHWRVAVDGLTPTATGIRATARDAAGNTSAATNSAPFAFVPTIADPADGSTATGGPLPVTITGWADTDVEVAVDGALVGTVSTGAGGRFSGHIRRGDTGLTPGRHTITVRYRDDAGASTESTTVTITVAD